MLTVTYNIFFEDGLMEEEFAADEYLVEEETENIVIKEYTGDTTYIRPDAVLKIKIHGD